VIDLVRVIREDVGGWEHGDIHLEDDDDEPMFLRDRRVYVL
jgi:hypothetical protein